MPASITSEFKNVCLIAAFRISKANCLQLLPTPNNYITCNVRHKRHSLNCLHYFNRTFSRSHSLQCEIVWNFVDLFLHFCLQFNITEKVLRELFMDNYDDTRTPLVHGYLSFHLDWTKELVHAQLPPIACPDFARLFKYQGRWQVCRPTSEHYVPQCLLEEMGTLALICQIQTNELIQTQLQHCASFKTLQEVSI